MSTEERIAALEKTNFRINVVASVVAIALTIALSIVSGLTWTSIIRRAKAAAEDTAERIAKKYIEEDGGLIALQTRATEAADRADEASSKARDFVDQIEPIHDRAQNGELVLRSLTITDSSDRARIRLQTNSELAMISFLDETLKERLRLMCGSGAYNGGGVIRFARESSNTWVDIDEIGRILVKTP